MKKKWIVVSNLFLTFEDGSVIDGNGFSTKEAALAHATNQVSYNKLPQFIFEMTEAVRTKENPAIVEEIKA